jgi:hypothetical protein
MMVSKEGHVKPGVIRTFKKGDGNAVVLAVGLWASRKTNGGPIDIHITGTPTFHTTIKQQPKLRAVSPHAFSELSTADDRTKMLALRQ